MSFEERFNGRVTAYRRSRPSYPSALLGLLRERAALNESSTVVDVGAGTGLLSELLAETNARILAVEPNREMVEVLRDCAGITPVVAPAESIPLDDDVADLITIAQAFHWLDPIRASRELHRIAKPAGWIAVIWNERRLEGDLFLEGYESLLREFGIDYAAVAARYDDLDALRTLYGKVPEPVTMMNTQTLDQGQLHLRILSSSYMPKADHPRYDAMLKRVDALFALGRDERDRVTLVYDTKAYIGQVRV